LPLADSGIDGIAYFLTSTGFVSPFLLIAAAVFGGSSILSWILFIAMGIFILVYWIFLVLLANNRAGAKAASVALMVFCLLDFPFATVCCFEVWWSILVFFAFRITLFITLAMMFRTRPGATVPLNKIPEKI
jgi:hypothetical protein